MIPDIGLMIAAYIITRLVDLLGRAEANIVAKILAVLSILVVLVTTVDLLSHGTSQIPSFPTPR